VVDVTPTIEAPSRASSKGAAPPRREPASCAAARRDGHGHPARVGAADVSLVAATVRQVIHGPGPGGTGGNTVNETLDVLTVAVHIARTAVLLDRITKASAVP